MGAVAFERGLIGHWPMDERSGGTAYDQALDNDGTIHGAVFTRGMLGWTLKFDGVDDYIGVPPDSSLNVQSDGTFTLSAWIYVSGYIDRHFTIFQKKEDTGVDDINQGYWFFIADGSDTSPQGALVLMWGNGSTNNYDYVYSSGTISTGSWHHVAIVRDSPNDDVEFYIDGSLDSTLSATLGHVVNDYSLFLGCHWSSGGGLTDPAEGNIDEPRIYDRALTESEIKDLYYYGAEPLPRHVPKLEAKV